MSRNIVAGNWKMNKTFAEANELVEGVLSKLPVGHEQVIIGVPYPYLAQLADITRGNAKVAIAAQNCHHKEAGAYTGEVSAGMLKSVGVDYVIIGHSERRACFSESNDQLSQKVSLGLKHGLSIIFCCGESLEEREANNHFNLVATQLQESLFHVQANDFSRVVVAYEPVWAIGTGHTATPEQAQEMHTHIRQLVAANYDEDIAAGTSILYGGSCNPGNSRELFSNPDIDGGLIGGASLNADDFTAIITAF